MGIPRESQRGFGRGCAPRVPGELSRWDEGVGGPCGDVLPGHGTATPAAFPQLQPCLINNGLVKGISLARGNKCSHTACVSAWVQITRGIRQRCNRGVAIHHPARQHRARRWHWRHSRCSPELPLTAVRYVVLKEIKHPATSQRLFDFQSPARCLLAR